MPARSIPEILQRYAAPQDNFLGLAAEDSDFSTARYRILPVPYEGTVSYGSGTGRGPAAILAASRQIEFYDAELDLEACREGIATLPALEGGAAGPAEMAERLEAVARALKEPGRVVIALGGEHSITPPLARPYLEASDTWLLCIDAHADLRPTYQGTPHSHACALHACAATGRTAQVGIRALSKEEYDFARQHNLCIFYDWQLDDQGAWMDRLFECLGPRVYLSLDVDGLDPAIMPATGTPEPGGLSWRQLVRLLDRLGSEREVVAADLVELAPIPGMHAPDFLAARAVYRLIGALERGRRSD